jgi:hypothetical protein
MFTQVVNLYWKITDLDVPIGCILSEMHLSIHFHHPGIRTVYIGRSGCRRNVSVSWHYIIVCKPGGSVNRKIPELYEVERSFYLIERDNILMHTG